MTRQLRRTPLGRIEPAVPRTQQAQRPTALVCTCAADECSIDVTAHNDPMGFLSRKDVANAAKLSARPRFVDADIQRIDIAVKDVEGDSVTIEVTLDQARKLITELTTAYSTYRCQRPRWGGRSKLADYAADVNVIPTRPRTVNDHHAPINPQANAPQPNRCSASPPRGNFLLSQNRTLVPRVGSDFTV